MKRFKRNPREEFRILRRFLKNRKSENPVKSYIFHDSLEFLAVARWVHFLGFGGEELELGRLALFGCTGIAQAKFVDAFLDTSELGECTGKAQVKFAGAYFDTCEII